MKEITKSTKNWTKMSEFNAIIGKSLNENVGKAEAIEVNAMAVGKDVERETGETKYTSYIQATDGTVYSSISSTIYEQVFSLIDIMSEEQLDTISVKVNSHPSKAKKNREYLTLTVLW